MKTTQTLFIVAAALLPLAVAETPASAPTVQQHHFITQVREAIKIMDDISSIFATVKDKSSADAAAAILPDRVAKLASIYAEDGVVRFLNTMNTPEHKALSAELDAAEKRMFEAAAFLNGADCYGSAALQKIVSLF